MLAKEKGFGLSIADKIQELKFECFFRKIVSPCTEVYITTQMLFQML